MGKERRALQNFKDHKPPPFPGAKSTVPPQQAENWISKLEETFHVSDTQFGYWPVFGASMLRGEARRWWSSIQDKLDVTVLSWGQFVDLFNTRFIDKAYRYAKLREFITLTQGEISVAEYKAKFIALSRYAAQIVGDGEMKATRFEDGLDLKIRSKVVPLMCTTFDDVVRAALLFENEIHSGFQDQSTSVMENIDTDTQGNHNGACKNNFVNNSPCGIQKNTIKDRKCYGCQQYGHIQSSCPNLRCPEMKYSDADTEGNHNKSGGKNRKARKNISVKNSPYGIKKNTKKDHVKNSPYGIKKNTKKDHVKNSPDGIKKNTNEDRACFVCQQYGHIQKSCPMLGYLDTMRGNRKCYNCRQFGHAGDSCPLVQSHHEHRNQEIHQSV